MRVSRGGRCRWRPAALLVLVGVVAVGCSSPPPQRWGAATVWLDGVRLGRGGEAAPHVTCFGAWLGMPQRIVPLERQLPWVEGDWVPRKGDAVQVGMDLRLAATDPPSATIVVTVDEARYETATTTDVTLTAGWTGSAAFDGLVLDDGPEGSPATIAFSVAWACDVVER